MRLRPPPAFHPPAKWRGGFRRRILSFFEYLRHSAEMPLRVEAGPSKKKFNP
jgi:hypothetical protein